MLAARANSLGYLDPLMRQLKATSCWSSVHVQRSLNAVVPSLWIPLHHIVTVSVESCLFLSRVVMWSCLGWGGHEVIDRVDKVSIVRQQIPGLDEGANTAEFPAQ